MEDEITTMPTLDHDLEALGAALGFDSWAGLDELIRAATREIGRLRQVNALLRAEANHRMQR